MKTMRKENPAGFSLRRTIAAFLISGSLLALFAGCAGEEVREPNIETQYALEAMALAENIRAAYERKSFDALESYLTGELYNRLRPALGGFKSAELSFETRLIQIDRQDVVSMNVAWEGGWISPEGLKQEEQGSAVFEFAGSPLRLRDIVHSNPFTYPRRQE